MQRIQVHALALGVHLALHARRQVDQRRLGRAVRRRVGDRDGAGARGNVEDAA